MSHTVYFLDASALVKRYAVERGSAWVESIANAKSDNVIAIAQVTLAEVAAALASKLRGQFMTGDEFERAVEDLLHDAFESFTLIEVDQQVVMRAVAVVRRQSLRGYDAIQLACGLMLNDTLIAAEELPLIFVTADKTLLSAAQAEGLQAEDPNDRLD